MTNKKWTTKVLKTHQQHNENGILSDKFVKIQLTVLHLSIFCPPGGAAGIHGALDRRPFLTGGNLINLWNPGPG